ncbi:MAG: helix-turn-helix transcriptional regulator [Acidobacteriota bacterium]
MKREDTVPLDGHFLVRRLEVLGMKQWWLARQLGVSRKTVSRWVSGKVKRIAADNLAALARELDCSPDELTSAEADEVLATREEQRAAAEVLQERDLLQLLSPSDDWKLAESLIKATMEPNLPLASLGRLQNLLSIAAWRQGHYEEGLSRADRAHEIGRRLGDRGIEMKAVLNRATIHAFVGPVPQALDEYRECLDRPERFDTARDHGAALSNIAWLHREAGDLDAALEAQEASIRVFDSLELDYNLAISWISMTLHATELGRFEEAGVSLDKARHHAEVARYERGLTCCDLYEADFVGLGGDTERALELIATARPRLDGYEVFDLTCLEICARQYRLAGELEKAEAELTTALDRAAGLPTIRAFLWQERSRLAAAMGQPELEQECRAEANALFAEHGLHARVADHPLPEHGRR